MNKKLFHNSILALIYLTILGIIYVGYLLYFPFKTFEVKQNPANVLNPENEVKRGGIVFYEVSYCKYTDKPAQVSKLLVNDVIFPGTAMESNLPVGCGKKEASYKLPDIEIKGKHHLIITLTYRLNFLRRETVTFETEPFYIIP